MRPNPFHRRARAAVHSVLATLLATSCIAIVTIPAAYAMPQTTEFADGGGNDGDDVASGQVDAPDLVGRVSAISGQVTISHGADNPDRAALNWPVTSQTRITVASGASVEFRAGSAALRLAGNSELEVVELDDDTLRLHLNYGTVAVRVRDTEMAEGFELITGQGRVTLTQPSRLRADAGADADDTTIVSVFDGEAQVEGGMTSMNLRAGRRAEVREDGMRTTQAMPDSFDQWQEAPAAAPPALRYVSEQVTGYETLDQYGNWTESTEYGPLWTPSALPAGWAPYQYGRWVWVAPWGWTWIDNAPWGYAPSHYGSWVQVGGHWRWAPGRNRPRPVWAPALVGWGDGHSGNLHRRDGRRQGPPSGWSPLTPHQPYSPFVPGLHTSPGYADRINDYRNGRSDRDRYRRDRTRDHTWDQGV
jgi:hypothetical protein